MLRRNLLYVAGACIGAAGICSVANAEEAVSLSDAITEGELILQLRPRIETLDQSGLAEADAYTLRTRLGWKTASWNGFSGLIEFEDVRDLGGDYNDGVPPAEPYATIGDPSSTELNRLQLTWRANEHFSAIIGRQNVEFDDKRFLDGSNARQDSRTHDALRADLSFGATKATYVYIDHVNNTTADLNDWESESHLLNVSRTFSPALKLTGFVYAFDFEPPAVASSTRFVGVRATGQVEAGELRFDYAASFVNQQDYGAATANYELDYWQASLRVTRGEWSGQVWYESLEGDGARGFFTPLGSANSFHGWAGAFVTKPADGLNDFNVMLSYTPEWAPEALSDLTFMVRAYAFEAERSGVDFGNEIDFQISADLTDQLSLGIDHSDYEAGDTPSPASRTRTRFVLEYKL